MMKYILLLLLPVLGYSQLPVLDSIQKKNNYFYDGSKKGLIYNSNKRLIADSLEGISNIEYHKFDDKPSKITFKNGFWITAEYDVFSNNSLRKLTYSTGDVYDFLRESMYFNKHLFTVTLTEGIVFYNDIIQQWDFNSFADHRKRKSGVIVRVEGEFLIVEEHFRPGTFADRLSKKTSSIPLNMK